MKKVVIITGAGSGIGAATAEYLLKRGYTVYGIDLKVGEQREFPVYQADVSDSEAIREIFERIYESEGRIDALVNNAGVGLGGAIEDTDIERMRGIVEVNMLAVCVCTKLIIPFLKRSKGRVVNIGSVGGVIPLPYQAMYSSTKAAVEVFSRAVNTEVRPFGVRVTCVLPGDTKTDFTDSRVVNGSEGSDNSERMRRFVGKMEKDERNGMSPVCVAKAVYKAISCKRRRLRITVGGSYKFVVFLSKILPIKMIDALVRKIYS